MPRKDNPENAANLVIDPDITTDQQMENPPETVLSPQTAVSPADMAFVGTQGEILARPVDPESEDSERRRTFVHKAGDEEHDNTLDQVEFDDLYLNPERYQGLFCHTCQTAIRLGEDGELSWKGTETKVLGENDTKERHG